jgi:hypothetical protein
MAASATLTIPLALTSSAQREAALKILNSTPGTSDIALGAESASVKLQLPGNIDILMHRLASANLAPPESIGVSIPVKVMVPAKFSPAKMAADLDASPAVSGAAYDGNVVTATMVAHTNSIRYIFEELEVNGLMPIDMPTPAGPLEFVL